MHITFAQVSSKFGQTSAAERMSCSAANEMDKACAIRVRSLMVELQEAHAGRDLLLTCPRLGLFGEVRIP